MRRWMLIILCAGCIVQIHAQSMAAADSLFYAERFEAAVKAYDDVLQLPGKKNRLDAGNAWLRRGYSLAELLKKQAALESYFKALEVYETLKNDERIAAAQINIANIYDEQDDLPAAEKYFAGALDISYRTRDSARIVNLLNDLAGIHYKKGAFRKAIELHTIAFTKYAAVLNDEILCNHLLNLGNCYESNQSDSSLYFYYQAESVAKDLEDTVLLARISLNIGDALKQAGKYRQAISYLEKSLRLNEGYGDSTDLSIIYESLAATYDSLKEYNKAYYYSRRENELNDGLYNVAKSQFATELAEKYESGKKDEKIKSQDIENRLKSRNLMISLLGLVLVAAMAVISFINYRRKQKANILLQQQNERIEKLNRELDDSNQVKSKLFSVISHDIRGPISSIYAYLQMQQTGNEGTRNEAFSRQTEQLLETLEDLLVWSKSQLHQFVPTMETVHPGVVLDQLAGLYLGLMEERKLQINNSIPGNVSVVTDLNMLTIILRNVLSNAVQYAAEGTVVTVSAVQMPNAVGLVISNATSRGGNPISVPNAHATLNSNATGLGITLIKEFTEKLGGTTSSIFQNGQVITTIQLPA